MVTREQLINGVARYADAEIMPCLPTSGKWIAGAFLVLATAKANELVNTVMTNPIASSLGLVSSDGLIDADSLCNALKQSADKYGKMEINIPLVGTLSFSASDVDKLHSYILGGSVYG